jgi:O-antigen/teichoic acid export membrane protein
MADRSPEGLDLAGRSALARGAGAAFGLQALGALLGFLLQLLLARWMSVRDYGIYAYVFAWATLLAVPIALGFPATILRFVSAYGATGDWARVRGVIQSSSRIVLSAGLGFGLAGTGVVLSLGAAGALDHVGPALVGVWLAPLLALATLQQELARAWRRIPLAFAPGLVLRPAGVIAGAGLTLALAGDLSAVDGLLVTLAVAAIVLVAQRVRLAAAAPRQVAEALPVSETRAWARVAAPLLLTALFVTLLRQTDVIVVGTILGADDTAVYNAAARTAGLVGFVLVATNAIAAPAIASLYAAGDRLELQRLAATIARWTFWPSVAIAVSIAVAAGPVLRLFGDEYDAARWPLTILVAGQLVNAATGSVGYLLTLTGHQDDTARVYGAVALGNLALMPVAVLLLGIEGAAVATAVSTAAWNVWLHRLVVRRVGIEASIVSGRTFARILRGARRGSGDG